MASIGNGYDLNALSGVLKDVYEDKIASIIPEKAYLLSTLETADPREFAGGLSLQWLVDVEPNGSYGVNRSDGLELPDPGRRKQIRANTDVNDHWSSTSVTLAALDRAKQGEAAFYNVADKAVKDVVTDLRRKIDHALYRRASWTVTADSTGTTVTLDNTQYINVGDTLTFGNRTTGAGAATRKVTAKNNQAGTVTVDSNITVTAANSGAWYTGAGPTDTKVIDSLDLAASEGRTLHGIDSTVYRGWDGNTKDLSGAVADEGDVMEIFNRIWEREEGEVTDAITTIGIQTRIANQMVSQKRYTNAEAVKLRGGFTALFVNDKPVVAQQGVPKGRFYAYDRSKIRMHKGATEFEKPPGASTIWKQTISSNQRYQTEYMCSYRYQLNLLHESPGSEGRLINCEDDKTPAQL